MATVLPFRGVLYNPEKVGDLGDVVAPPYDVISERQRQGFMDRHGHNIVRLILSQGAPGDDERRNKYTRAAEAFRKWQDEGALVRDERPAMYLTVMDYVSGGVERSRLGLIVLVELEEFGRGGIIPHEKTFSATKADRLKLMEACESNFSPIFSVFSDPHDEVFGSVRHCMETVGADFDFFDSSGCRHRMWRITQDAVHADVARKLADKPLYIADGHHRYETALNYRDAVASRTGGHGNGGAADFVMMYLSSMQDPGLIIRPVHRMLSGVSESVLERFYQEAEDFFHLETLKVPREGYGAMEQTLSAKIGTGAGRRAMGVVIGGHENAYVIQVRPGVMADLFAADIPGPLRELDVTIVTKLIFQKIFGLSDEELDDEDRIRYTSRMEKALAAVSSGDCAVSLIINPTRLSDVEAVSNARLIMPRKSTYFYPKVLSGLVINRLD